MRICWFANFRGATLTDRLAPLLAATLGLDEALIHTSASTHDPYLDDGPPPSLALQVYFKDIAAMEAALTKGGHLQALADPAVIPGIASATQQAMIARPFPVPDATFRTPPGGLPCTYLVAYEGAAEDLNLWLDYYIRSHPPIMARFPGIRQVEICTRIDWIDFLPFARVDHMQRNKVVFDDQAALTSALNSPVRHEMRDDFKHFPPFTGPNTHYPMHTRTVGKAGSTSF
ncbi:MAG: hypothetical protein NT133_26495 [Alphaproteobacteria bacterium]|nr:hypothetical protein [Alphaproteobacteria bacterium]